MSAFLVDREHIRALVDAACELGLIENDRAPYCLRDAVTEMQNAEWERAGQPTYTTAASYVGRILWAENVKSLEARYPDTITAPEGRPGPVGDGPDMGAPFVFVKRRFHLLPGAVGKAVACYAYQTCEHDGWKDSPARDFCDALVKAALDKCPGASSCPWDISSDEQDAPVDQYGSNAPRGRSAYCHPADNTISLMDMVRARKRP